MPSVTGPLSQPPVLDRPFSTLSICETGLARADAIGDLRAVVEAVV